MMKNSYKGIMLMVTSFLASMTAKADCLSSPDCTSLGYDKGESECGIFPFVRCPFDITRVMCLESPTCADMGYEETILASMKCAEVLVAGKTCYRDCGKICAVSDIYYSDKTCSTDLISGKTPIGVVGYVTNEGKNGLVVALDSAPNIIQSGCFGTDLILKNYVSQSSALSDFSGEINTDVIASQCGSNTAAYYCKNTYNKGGVSEWYLPAYGELYAILYTNFSAVNVGLGKFSSKNQITYGRYHWSSSERDSSYGWLQYAGNTYSYNTYKNVGYYVRCVLAF